MRERERPVISMVRLGRQTAPIMEPMQYALLNVKPRATNRSKFGVWISELPSARDRVPALVVGENQQNIRRRLAPRS